VNVVDHEAEALAIKYDGKLDAYISSVLHWVVDTEGKVLPGTVQEELLEYISTKREKGDSPLPAVANHWDNGAKPRLRQQTWDSALGLKIL
jgi:hypothetical protein